MVPGDVLRVLGGSARRSDLLQHCTRWQIEHAARRGEIERIRRGRYALPGLPPGLATAMSFGGSLSHESAAQYWKLDAIAVPTRVHVTLRSNAHRPPERGVTWHYGELGDQPVTSPLRTVLDCARSLPFREALAIADSALRRKVISGSELVAAAERLTGPGSGTVRRVCSHADARSANPFESALRSVVIDARLRGFEPQLLIQEEGQWRVDLGHRRLRIVLEADSFAFHGTRAALDRDCRRYDDLVSRNWLVLRFSWEQVMFDQEWVEQVTRAVCLLRTSRPGGPSARKRPSKHASAA